MQHIIKYVIWQSSEYVTTTITLDIGVLESWDGGVVSAE
jgi:hypothetical protein